MKKYQKKSGKNEKKSSKMKNCWRINKNKKKYGKD